ncbi:hypothetical protein GCM10007159_41320 [Modicisalibacter luteus]|nr:hypothetical protein GCM10007159_41320 [Halomonas lutea]
MIITHECGRDAAHTRQRTAQRADETATKDYAEGLNKGNDAQAQGIA